MVIGTSSSSHPGRRKVARAGALCSVVVALGVLGGNAQGVVANENELPTYPETGEYIGVRATSVNYATSAKQWIQLPPLFIAAYNRLATTLTDNRCPGGVYFPYRNEIKRDASLHFRSSPGAPAAFGYIGPFTVRAVAFGSIPVEAEVQLRQLRDSEDKTIGLRVKQTDRNFCPGEGPIPGASQVQVDGADATGDLEVAVTAVRVDGVDLRLRDTCKTSRPAPLTLSSTQYFTTGEFADQKEYYVRSGSGFRRLKSDEIPIPENLFTTPVFNLAQGGLLAGNVDIPPFAGCTTRDGEDVSELLTATVSGSKNPTVTRSEGLNSDPSSTPLPGLPFPTATP